MLKKGACKHSNQKSKKKEKHKINKQISGICDADYIIIIKIQRKPT